MPKIQPRDVAWAPRIRLIEKWVSFFSTCSSNQIAGATANSEPSSCTTDGPWAVTSESLKCPVESVGYPPAIKHGLLGKPACTLMNVPLKAHPNRNLTDSMMAPVPLTTMSSLYYDCHGPLHPGCWRFRSSVVLHSWHRTTWDLSRPSRCRGAPFFWGKPMGVSWGIPWDTKSWSMPTAPGGLAMAPLGLDDHGWTRRWLLVSRRRWDGEGRRTRWKKSRVFAMENHRCSKVNIG